MVKIIAGSSKIPPTVELHNLPLNLSVVDIPLQCHYSIRKYKKREQRKKLRRFRSRPETRSLKSSSMITMYVNWVFTSCPIKLMTFGPEINY